MTPSFSCGVTNACATIVRCLANADVMMAVIIDRGAG
jgi:hypothetical protein